MVLVFVDPYIFINMRLRITDQRSCKCCNAPLGQVTSNFEFVFEGDFIGCFFILLKLMSMTTV